MKSGGCTEKFTVYNHDLYHNRTLNKQTVIKTNWIKKNRQLKYVYLYLLFVYS